MLLSLHCGLDSVRIFILSCSSSSPSSPRSRELMRSRTQIWSTGKQDDQVIFSFHHVLKSPSASLIKYIRRSFVRSFHVSGRWRSKYILRLDCCQAARMSIISAAVATFFSFPSLAFSSLVSSSSPILLRSSRHLGDGDQPLPTHLQTPPFFLLPTLENVLLSAFEEGKGSLLLLSLFLRQTDRLWTRGSQGDKKGERENNCPSEVRILDWKLNWARLKRQFCWRSNKWWDGQEHFFGFNFWNEEINPIFLYFRIWTTSNTFNHKVSFSCSSSSALFLLLSSELILFL